VNEQPAELTCSDYTDEHSCKNVHCKWMPPKCSGTSNTSCSSFNTSEDCSLPGCSWIGSCSGTPNQTCSDYTDEKSCSIVGCSWQPESCSGNVNTTCDQITDPDTCNMVGCKWDKGNDVCTGEILTCNKISTSYCANVGCDITPASCSGELSCDNINDENMCNSAGCSFTSECQGDIYCEKLGVEDCEYYGCELSEPYCTGELNCKVFSDNETSCINVSGCEWNPGGCSGEFACSNIHDETYCSNAGCSWVNENETTCPEDCAIVCGNDKCEEGEDYYNCPQDCPLPECSGTETDDCSTLQVKDPKAECEGYYSKSGYQCTVNKDLTGCMDGNICEVPQQIVCGNGIIEEGEECDYKASPTGCKEGYTCNDKCECVPSGPVCGDGLCEKGEKCSQDCSKETYCSDNIDNDEDNLIDCDDPDCSGDPACAQPSGETDCNDGIDNDDNGLTDCADPECSGNSACIYEKLGKDRTHVDVQISNNNVTQFNGYGINLVGLAGEWAGWRSCMRDRCHKYCWK